MCRRYRMPDNVEPFQPKDGPHRSHWQRVTRGCKVGGENSPHLVTLRDRLAALSMEWLSLGDAGEHHADDAGAFRRPIFRILPENSGVMRALAQPLTLLRFPFLARVRSALRAMLHGPRML